MFSRLLSNSRFIILIPVAGSWLASFISMGFGAYEILLTVFNLITGKFDPEKIAKLTVINLIEGIDLFLLGTVFYLIALGLYELFIDENAPVPAWLVIHDLDDLKSKLISVIVVVLAVQFMSQALNWKGDAGLLAYGAAIAAVVLSLGFFIGQKAIAHKHLGTAPAEKEK